MSTSVMVVGSVNMDLVVRGDHLPKPGETVIGGEYFQAAGGKGANQAVAAKRLGAERVTFVGAIGKDEFGRSLRAGLESEGIELSHLAQIDEAATGVAMILVDKGTGENLISVASGANGLVGVDHVEAVSDDDFRSVDVVLASLEVPLRVVARTLERAKANECKTLLNPAPVSKETVREVLDILRFVDVIVPNEIELETLGRLSDTDTVVTLGSEGCEIHAGGTVKKLPGYSVDAVDSTAAGDCFCGALAVQLAAGQGLLEACEFANRAAAISVSRRGAQPSIPRFSEVVPP